MLMRKRLLQLLATLALAWALPAPATELSSITLQPGEYLWMPELAPSGPLVVVISLPQQLGYVYRNGVRIGVTTVSTGKPGFETPAGVYRILQKRREHYSNRYDNAPMPYMQRLTWDGVALHAGRVRKSPASHGCVRLPETFASKLFEVTEHGMTVVIAAGDDGTPFPGQPGFFAPVKATTGTPRERQFSPPQRYHLSPELSPAGPLSVIISSADAQIVVVRNDIEIARSRIELPPGTRFGLHAYVMLEGSADVRRSGPESPGASLAGTALAGAQPGRPPEFRCGSHARDKTAAAVCRERARLADARVDGDHHRRPDISRQQRNGVGRN